MDRLKDKVVIMTGADGGICHCASQMFCNEGAKVVMVDIDPSVKDKCAEIVANGGDAIAIVADVSKKESWDEILKTTIDTYKTVDCCVNGAAEISLSGDYNNPTFSVDEFDNVFNTNIKSMLFSYQTVLQYMVDNNIKGNFINFSSATAYSFMGLGCQAYPMTKAAITICTKDMVKPHGKHGIRYNALAPNCVYVPKQKDTVYKPFTDWFKSIVPLGCLGEVSDVAHAMVFLASDEAKFVNGVSLPIDGGWMTCN